MLTERSARAMLKRWKRLTFADTRTWDRSHARSVLRCTSGSEISGCKKLFAAAQVALDKFLVKSAAAQADEKVAAMPPFLF